MSSARRHPCSRRLRPPQQGQAIALGTLARSQAGSPQKTCQAWKSFACTPTCPGRRGQRTRRDPCSRRLRAPQEEPATAFGTLARSQAGSPQKTCQACTSFACTPGRPGRRGPRTRREPCSRRLRPPQQGQAIALGPFGQSCAGSPPKACQTCTSFACTQGPGRPGRRGQRTRRDPCSRRLRPPQQGQAIALGTLARSRAGSPQKTCQTCKSFHHNKDKQSHSAPSHEVGQGARKSHAKRARHSRAPKPRHAQHVQPNAPDDSKHPTQDKQPQAHLRFHGDPEWQYWQECAPVNTDQCCIWSMAFPGTATEWLQQYSCTRT